MKKPKVKYLDLPAQFEGDQKVREVVRKVLDSGQFILGPAVEEFERNFACLCGTEYAIGVSSGTDALFLALKALGVGEGDEVITVPNTFIATVGAIAATGAFPRLVDVGEDYNIEPAGLEKAVNKNTKAIIGSWILNMQEEFLMEINYLKKYCKIIFFDILFCISR